MKVVNQLAIIPLSLGIILNSTAGTLALSRAFLF
jgi:hypothetical protein